MRRRGGKSNFEKYYGFEAEADILLPVKPAAHHERTGYLPYKKAMTLSLANQPKDWDPEDPPMKPTSFPNEIHYLVQDNITNDPEFENCIVRYFTSSQSALDQYHGTDSFFLLSDADGNLAHATLDVTLNPKKAARGHKADLIGLLPTDYTDSEVFKAKDREQLLRPWAQELAEILKSRLQSRRRDKQALRKSA